MNSIGNSISTSHFFEKYRKRLKLRIKIFLVALAALLAWFYFSLPSKLFTSPTSFVIEDKNGNLLNASIASDGQWRFPYDDDVPTKFIKCITTFEDKRFYYHPGVDPLALGRAISKNIKKIIKHKLRKIIFDHNNHKNLRSNQTTII